jgi:tRNA A37 threonylcarbamoyladenosine modification protein TsaB
VSAVDGRRGDVFFQTFELGESVEARDQAAVAAPQDVAARWSRSGAPLTFTGDGVERYRGDFDSVVNATICTQLVPSLHAALWLGEAASPQLTIEPLYLREADAVANFATRERPQ